MLKTPTLKKLSKFWGKIPHGLVSFIRLAYYITA